MKPPRTEKSLLFPGANNRQLFCAIHYPSGTDKKTGFLYCHPFGEEKNLSHRIGFKVAQNISKKGYPVMRFDLSGCGDSDGELNEITIEDWLKDISAAEIYFRNLFNLEQCVLWGLRFGGYLALHNAAMQTTIDGLILWQPICDPQAYFQQLLRHRYSTRLIAGNQKSVNMSSLIQQLHNDSLINIMGYPISRKLYESFIKNRTFDRDNIHNMHILVLSISLFDAANPPILSFMDHLSVCSSNISFEHIKEEPFWDRPWRYHCPITEQVTVDWILKHL